MVWIMRRSIDDYLRCSGNIFWDNCIYIEHKKEFQCLVEQCVSYHDDIECYWAIDALKSAKIYKKWFSNILYCKEINANISKYIVDKCLDDRRIENELREKLFKSSDGPER